MRKLFSLFVALLATTALWAQRFQVGDLYYKITNDTLVPYTVEVTYESIRTANYPDLISVTIPRSVINKGKTYSVTSIGEYAFRSSPSLESITIPNSVTSIGEYAFLSCKSLTSITIPNNVTSIGGCTFSGCSSLTSISIPNSVISIGERAFTNCYSLATVTLNSDAVVSKNYIPDSTICTIFGSQVKEYVIGNSVTAIGDYAFFHCDSLTSIAIGNSVKSIGNCAFWGCKLTSIDIPNSVTTIGDWTFAFCDSLTSIILGNNVTSIGHDAFTMCKSLISINIPNSVISIGEMAFSYCDSLSSIILGNNVTSIGESAFRSCSSLTSITLPNSITNIGDMTFLGCNSLTSVTIGNSVTNIGYGAFVGCKSLTSINISNSVTSIEKHAFYNCSSLASVTLGNSITNIEDSVFFMCNSLDTIYCYATIPPVVENAFVNNDETNNYKATLYVLCESLEAYKAHSVWSQFANIKCLEEENEANSPNKIYYTSSDGNIVNPHRTDAFDANIISNTYENGQGVIEFDASITSIGDTAFATCSTLTNITIPNTVKHIGVDAFLSCSSINSIIIPDKVESIDSYAFGWCSSLESIIIPNSVTYIGYGIFAGCDSLTSVVVDNQNPVYDSRNNCNAIIETATNTLIAGCKNTVIPNTIISIGRYAFVSCYFLPSVTIPQGVKSIGNYAFSACSRIPSINIPKSVTQIGYKAFATGADLAEIIVETGNPIYDSRENCNAIIETATNTLIAGCKNTAIPNTVEHIGGAAFYGCQYMANPLVIPEGVKTIGEGAFMFCLSLPSISIPNSVTWIDGYAFYQCSSLTSITIPENVTNIGAYAFYLCNALKSVTWNAKNCADFEPYEAIVPFYLIRSQITSFTFGDKVEHIPAYLCYNMDNLSSITIPEHVTSIGEGALAYCLYDTIYCLSATPPAVNKAFSSNGYNATLYTPCESLEVYKAHEVWGRFNTIQCLEDLIPDPTERVLSCAEAVIVCLETGATATTEEYTIHGYVTEITTEYSEQYKNISFYMADTKDGGQVLFTYRIKPMYEADIAVKVGDFVEVVGKLVNYNGYLPEVYPGVYTIVNEPELPTGTSDIQLPTSNTKKVVKDGQLLILRDGKTYTIMGAEVK